MDTTGQNEKKTRYHWLLFAICFLGTAFAGMISTLMSVYLPVAVRDLPGSRSEEDLNYISSYINSVFIFGAAIGGFICGVISDQYGRKPAVILSIALCGVFAILTGFMPGWWTVAICRFFSGFGLGGVLVTATTLLVEEWPQKTRAIFVGILSISFPVGIFSAGAIDYIISSWRQAFLAGAMPAGLAVLSIVLLRESKAWRYHREHIAQTRQNFTGIFSKNYRNSLMAGAAIFGSMLIGLWAIFLWLPTWIQTLITTGDGQKERGLSMMILGIGGLAGGFLSGWMVNGIGIRKSMLLCFAVCAVLSLVLFRTNDSFSPVVYAEIIVLALSFGASQGVLSLYVPGLFPVSIRGAATGFCFNTGRVFTAIAVLFVGLLVSVLGGYSNSLFLFSLVFIIGLAVTFFANVETGNNIPERNDNH